MPSNKDSAASGWVGWIVFAAVLLIMDGIFQIVIGMTALFNPSWFVLTQHGLAVFNLTTWGWVQSLLGLLLIGVGWSLFHASVVGRTLAVFIAALSAVANLAFISAYPIWSIVVIVVDILVIYALVVHGGEMREA
jgi:hypothetical protein